MRVPVNGRIVAVIPTARAPGSCACAQLKAESWDLGGDAADAGTAGRAPTPHRLALLVDPQPVGEDPDQPAQALGRHQHQRAEPPAGGAGALGERRDPEQRDQGLADAGLAVEHQRGVGRQVDRGLLLGIEHRQRAAIGGRPGDRLGPRHHALAVLADHAGVVDQRLAVVGDHPARDDAAAGDPLAGLDLVGLAGPVAEERLGQRRGAPVEHRDLAVDLGPRPEQVRPVTALGRDREIPLRRGSGGQQPVDLVEAHASDVARAARFGKLGSRRDLR